MEAGAYDEVLDALAAALRAQLAEVRASATTELVRNELLERWVTRSGQGELSGEERWIDAAVSNLLIALDPPRESEPAAPDPTPGTSLYRLQLLCEVTSRSEVDRLLDAMQVAACPYPDAEDHECPIPWMTMASRIADDDEEAAGIREMLNRR